MKKRGGISWYGGPHDKQDNNRTYTGIPNSSVAGIATRYENTKKGWWFLHEPGHPERGQLVQDIEKGPGVPSREFDLNPRAAAKFGWRANDAAFPTDKQMEGVFLGHDFHQASVRANRLKMPRARRRVTPPTAVDRWPATAGQQHASSATATLGGLSLPEVATVLQAIRA